jgi:hypothetical protein
MGFSANWGFLLKKTHQDPAVNSVNEHSHAKWQSLANHLWVMVSMVSMVSMAM